MYIYIYMEPFCPVQFNMKVSSFLFLFFVFFFFCFFFSSMDSEVLSFSDSSPFVAGLFVCYVTLKSKKKTS